MIKKFFFVLAIFLSVFQQTRAQESQNSMMQDISYPYLEKLIAVAREKYPKSKMYNSRIDAANAVIKKNRLSYFDALSFTYLYSPNNSVTLINQNPSQPSGSTRNLLNGYQLGLVVNAGALLQKPALVKQAKAEQEVVVYERDAFDLTLKADVEQRYYIYVQRKAILRTKIQALLDVESMLKDVKYKYEKGQETLESYNKMLLMISDHTQGKMTAESEMLVAKSRLEELVGEKLENIKL
ncbi:MULTISPECIES: TolC family protein [unclassified Siphonobacter]|uniref:TolC family protein n=1 Tax=unclassified Siphonobacter TaxID=2635712 RepID=UPI000CBAE550|nr:MULTISPECIES: TolC family protein [unclassified Siphonobacter]PKK35690.1 hypothetical protein BWI96_15385 [Siphonobacter sp. SORGH_AS_0500]